jgi:hypothetical protein
MKEKLSSRKLWIALGGLFMVVATEWIGISPEASQQVIDAVVIIVPAYLGGQGIVDAFGAWNAGKK